KLHDWLRPTPCRWPSAIGSRWSGSPGRSPRWQRVNWWCWSIPPVTWRWPRTAVTPPLSSGCVQGTGWFSAPDGGDGEGGRLGAVPAADQPGIAGHFGPDLADDDDVD